MIREPMLEYFKSIGATLNKAAYVENMPHLSGFTEDELLQLELIGAPGNLKIASVIGAFGSDLGKERTRQVLTGLVPIIYPEDIDKVLPEIDRAIAEAEKDLNTPVQVIDLHHARMGMQMVRMPGQRILLTRIEWRLM